MNIEPRQVWRFKNGKHCVIVPNGCAPREERRLMRLAKRTMGIAKADFQSMVKARAGMFDESGGIDAARYLKVEAPLTRDWWALDEMRCLLPSPHAGIRYVVRWS